MDVVRDADGTERETPGGGPFNTARALGRLAVPVGFLGHLSSDARGRRLAECLRADGVSLELPGVGPEPTTVAAATLDAEGRASYRFQVAGTAAPNLTLDHLPQELGPEVQALHVGTLGLVLEPMASTVAALVRREHGRRLVAIDPNVRAGLIDDAAYRQRLHELLGLSTLVKASAADLAWVYPDLDAEAAAERLLDRGVRLVVITLGPEGAWASGNGAHARVPAPPVSVADTIGAGDAFGAAVLAWLYEHDALDRDLKLEAGQLRSLLEFACQVAALTCARAGAEPPWRRELAGAGPPE